MKYIMHFFKERKLEKTIRDNVFMEGACGKFLYLDVSSYYDEMRLHDEENRYIATYNYVSTYEGKSVFKR